MSTTAKDGHAAGAAKIREFLGWCDDLGIQVVTLYLLSTDNLTGRKPGELDDLLEIIAGVTSELSAAQLWSIKWVGDAEGLPEHLVSALKDAEKKTKGLGKTHVNLAVGYGGRKEIADAMRAIVTKHAKKGASIESLAEQLTEAARFHDYRYASNPITDGTLPAIPGARFAADLHEQGPTRTLPLHRLQN
jgi:short-chain Z-isoprenyl diphosphate synthase